MRSGAKTPRRSSATGQGFALPWMIGVVLLFHQFFKRMPRELAEAAALDGAGTWHTFTRVMLPAASLLSLLPLALAFLLGQRYLMRWRVSPASGV